MHYSFCVKDSSRNFYEGNGIKDCSYNLTANEVVVESNSVFAGTQNIL
jgi:hypothetical protein